MPVLIERPGFRFAAAECAKASGKPLIPEFPALPSGAPGYEGVKPAVWRENGTLELEALLVQRCGIGFADAGYKVDKRVLSLEYKLDASQPAACNCLYRLSYQISGLPRAEYDVRFKGTGGDPNE